MAAAQPEQSADFDAWLIIGLCPQLNIDRLQQLLQQLLFRPPKMIAYYCHCCWRRFESACLSLR